MYVWVNERDFKYLKGEQDEARTRTIEVSSFKRDNNDIELQLAL